MNGGNTQIFRSGERVIVNKSSEQMPFGRQDPTRLFFSNQGKGAKGNPSNTESSLVVAEKFISSKAWLNAQTPHKRADAVVGFIKGYMGKRRGKCSATAGQSPIWHHDYEVEIKEATNSRALILFKADDNVRCYWDYSTEGHANLVISGGYSYFGNSMLRIIGQLVDFMDNGPITMEAKK